MLCFLHCTCVYGVLSCDLCATPANVHPPMPCCWWCSPSVCLRWLMRSGSGMSSTTWPTSLCGGRRCPSACKGVHRSSGANGVERVGVMLCHCHWPSLSVLGKDTCPSPVLGVCACVSNNVGRSPSAHVLFSYLQLSMYYLYTYIYMYVPTLAPWSWAPFVNYVLC